MPGYLWHITHRCHRREFLLRFIRDRRRYLHWLFEAKKRQNLTILNYMVTSNHIHLLVEGGEDRKAIPRAMQPAAGRSGQQYNMRKHREGAFWQGRYHATAVESGEHLRRCMAYIDLNMVRAGVVAADGVSGVECRVSGACVVQKYPSTEMNSVVGDWCVLGRLVQK